MGRHSKKFHNLRAMNENRRAKALALASGLPPPAPITQDSLDRNEEKDSNESVVAKPKPKRVAPPAPTVREPRVYEKPVRTHQPYNPYGDDGADGEENEVKRRPRREIRRPDNNGIPLALANLLESSRKIKRNPGRFIPNLPGFAALSKLESKRDVQAIGRDNSYEAASDIDSDDDEYEANPSTFFNPSCPPDSNIHKKRARVTTWASNPQEMTHQLKRSRDHLASLRHDLRVLDDAEENWIHSFEMSRLTLNALSGRIIDEITHHKDDAKAMYRLFAADPKNFLDNTTSLGTRSSANPTFNAVNDTASAYPLSNVQIQEIVKSFIHSQSTLEMKVDQYEKLVKECGNGKSPRNKSTIPVIQMVVDEVDYEYDVNAFAKSTSSTLDDQLRLAEDMMKLSHDFSIDWRMITGNNDPASGDARRSESASIHVDKSKAESIKSSAMSLMKRSEADWVDFLQQHATAPTVTITSASPMKSGASTEISIPVSAHPGSYTPRDIRLIISPLSQFEDRYIAAHYGGQHHPTATSTSDVPIPDAIVREEDAAIIRCQLQSEASAADTTLRRLRLSLHDWRKIAAESTPTIQKSMTIHSAVLKDETSEIIRLRHELEAFGITNIAVSEPKKMTTSSSIVTHSNPISVNGNGISRMRFGLSSSPDDNMSMMTSSSTTSYLRNSPINKSVARAKIVKPPTSKASRASPSAAIETMAS